MIGALIRLVPGQVWAILGGITALVAIHFGLVWRAVDAKDTEWRLKVAKEQAAYKQQIADLENRQQQVVTKTITEYRDRVKIVKERDNAIITEIPKLAPKDAPLMLSGWMRVAHDAAATGNMPTDTERAVAAARPVEDVTLATTTAENYAACRWEYQKLIALQSIVSSLEEVK